VASPGLGDGLGQIRHGQPAGEAALKCRSWRKGRNAPPVHMIKLTATQEITPYNWVHPGEER